MTTDQFIGERVHQVMWRAKLKQTRVAPQMGITQTALSRKIRGERAWSLDELVQISGILRVSVLELVPPEMAAAITGGHDGGGSTEVVTSRYPASARRTAPGLTLVTDSGRGYPSVVASYGSSPSNRGCNKDSLVADTAETVNNANAA